VLYHLKGDYFTAIANVKTVADKHRHTAHHNRH